MAYLSFISDNDLLRCIGELHAVYRASFACKSFNELNKNIIDPFKFQFDTAFLYGNNPNLTLNNEIFRQSDKSITNALGEFHQKLIGCIPGYEETPSLPCDIRKTDNTIFAEVKNKHNTMNARSATSVFDELRTLATAHNKARCYLIEIIAKKSQCVQWTLSEAQTSLSHPRIFKISADKFYELATGKANAFRKLCDVLPVAIKAYLSKGSYGNDLGLSNDSEAYHELEKAAKKNEASIECQLFLTSFNKYMGYISS